MSKKFVFAGVLALQMLGTTATAEDRCPRGTFPAGGGYCQNIVCRQHTRRLQPCISGGGLCNMIDRYAKPDPDAARALENNGLSCSSGQPQWGDTYIPMR
jgi:hypothetical protein